MEKELPKELINSLMLTTEKDIKIYVKENDDNGIEPIEDKPEIIVNNIKIDVTCFEKQLEKVKPLTEDVLETLKCKTVSSGREKKVGDFVLYGMEESEELNEKGETYYTLITLTQDEIEKYIVTPNKSMFPDLNKKTNFR